MHIYVIIFIYTGRVGSNKFETGLPLDAWGECGDYYDRYLTLLNIFY